MDLITYALCKRQAERSIEKATSAIAPSIGENGNWYIGDKDTGIKANKSCLVTIDGSDEGELRADTVLQQISVIKGSTETVVGNATFSIQSAQINGLFE